MPHGSELQQRTREFDMINTQSPYTMFNMTEYGLDRYEEEVSRMREHLGYKILLAMGYLNGGCGAAAALSGEIQSAVGGRHTSLYVC